MKSIKKYFNQVIAELKKVSWPTKKQTINKTLLVILVTALAALYISGIDFILQSIMRIVIN